MMNDRSQTERLTLNQVHPDAYYDAAEVAALFKLTDATVRDMAARGMLRATRLGADGGLMRFKGAHILECAEERGDNTGPAPGAEPAYLVSDAGPIELLLARVALEIAREMRGIVPERVYPAAEAAELIGLRGDRRGKTIREIPRELLPATPITPQGGLVGYYGRDLIAYVEAQRAKANPHLLKK